MTKKPDGSNLKRIALSCMISVAVIAYIAGIISGYIPKDHQLDAVQLALIVLTVVGLFFLWRPEMLEKLKLLEVAGLKFHLEKIEEEQERQGNKLENLNLVLSLLLPKSEQTHLINLYHDDTEGYKGRKSLRAELRQLRSIELIRSLPGHYIGHMKDEGKYDLAEYVELTDLGKRCAQQLEQKDREEKES